MELKKKAIDAVLISIFYLLFLAAWGYIGNMFGLFLTIENFGIYGLTIGLVLAVALGIEVGNYVGKILREKVKALR